MRRSRWLLSLLSITCPIACADVERVNGSRAVGGQPRAHVVASDLVIVYPLPAHDELAALLGADDGTSGRSRLPAEAFFQERLPELDAAEPLSGEAARASLRVVVARLDPCPGVPLPARPGTVCSPELRLVFQSLVADGDGRGTHARDGAIHAFYALSAAELDGARGAIAAASPELVDGPIGVHPTLAREGLAGPFATVLRATLSALAVPTRLFRVTQFRRGEGDETGARFFFRQRERSDGRFFDENVPSTWAPEQTVWLASTGAGAAPRIAPGLTGEDDVTAVFRAVPDERAAAFDATVRVLHPSVHTANSIDCASCHLAGAVSRAAARRFDLDAARAPGAFSSPSLPAVGDADDPTAGDDLHMLSYRGHTLSVARRTRHEVAALLDHVRTRGRAGTITDR